MVTIHGSRVCSAHRISAVANRLDLRQPSTSSTSVVPPESWCAASTSVVHSRRNDWDDAVAAHRAGRAGESSAALRRADQAQARLCCGGPQHDGLNSALHRLAFGRGPGSRSGCRLLPQPTRRRRNGSFTAWAVRSSGPERADPRTAVGLASHDRAVPISASLTGPAPSTGRGHEPPTPPCRHRVTVPRPGAPSQRPGVEAARVHSAREDRPDSVDPGADGVVVSSAGEVAFADLPLRWPTSLSVPLPVPSSTVPSTPIPGHRPARGCSRLSRSNCSNGRSTSTVATSRRPRHCLSDPARSLAGSVTLADIGRSDRLCETRLSSPSAVVTCDATPLSASTATLGGRRSPAARPTSTPTIPCWPGDGCSPLLPDLAAQHLRDYLTRSVDVVLRTRRHLPRGGLQDQLAGRTRRSADRRRLPPGASGGTMGHSSYPLQALQCAVVALPIPSVAAGRLRPAGPSRRCALPLRPGHVGPDTPASTVTCGVFSWRHRSPLVLAVSDPARRWPDEPPSTTSMSHHDPRPGDGTKRHQSPGHLQPGRVLSAADVHVATTLARLAGEPDIEHSRSAPSHPAIRTVSVASASRTSRPDAAPPPWRPRGPRPLGSGPGGGRSPRCPGPSSAARGPGVRVDESIIIGQAVGTWKTTTVASVLALLAEQAAAAGQRPPRRAGAPTGKAAARVRGAMAEALSGISAAPRGRDRAVIAPIGDVGTTTKDHRPIGWSYARAQFRHHRGPPVSRLPHDVILVDKTNVVSHLTRMKAACSRPCDRQQGSSR